MLLGRIFIFKKKDPETSSIFSNKPLVSFRKNIRETLWFLAPYHKIRVHRMARFLAGCQMQNLWFYSATIISAPKSQYHVKHHFTCNSSHLIYCISWARCGMLYTGKIGRSLRTRFGEHRRAVSWQLLQPVAIHFNTGNHSVSDMGIRAFCSISGIKDNRKTQNTPRFQTWHCPPLWH
jgi:hypothetical protein